MFEVAKVGGYLVSPLTLALGLGLLSSMCLALDRRKWALWLASAAFIGLWLASTPLVAQVLVGELESRHPALSVAETPSADAILVLGGALAGASPPRRPNFNMGPASHRVWHAAALFRAGKAKWVIVAAGNQPGSDEIQVEADAIAEMLVVLGVPRSAIRLEGASRNTRENAANVQHIVQRLRARRVLLVTSALHMPRAVKTFTKVWQSTNVILIPAVADVWSVDSGGSTWAWLPDAGSLTNVTAALKEYAGGLAIDMM